MKTLFPFSQGMLFCCYIKACYMKSNDWNHLEVVIYSNYGIKSQTK